MTLTTLVLAAIFLGALTRATFGFGEAVVSMPLLALLPIGLHTAASLVGLAGLTVAVLSLAVGLRHVDRRALVRLSISTLTGIPVGLALILWASTGLVEVLLGLVLVGYAAYRLLGAERVTVVPGEHWAYLFGFTSGALGSAYNFNGVPVAVYGTLRRWEPPRFRGTLQAHFLISGAMIVFAQHAGGLWTPELPRLYLLALPVIGVATVTGHVLHRRIPAERFERAVYLLVLALGAVLSAKGGAILLGG